MIVSVHKNIHKQGSTKNFERDKAMSQKKSGERILSVMLVLGGLPPILSGVLAMFFGQAYFDFIGSGVAKSLGEGFGFALVVGNLQGGDAFVAGSSRVLVAFLGNLQLKRFFAVIGIFHSSFELWLLPTKLIPWCQNTVSAQCHQYFFLELYFFLALHGLLVLGFAAGLFLSFSKKSSHPA